MTQDVAAQLATRRFPSSQAACARRLRQPCLVAPCVEEIIHVEREHVPEVGRRRRVDVGAIVQLDC